MTSAWESLHHATLELVRSTPIKQRLVCAYRRHLLTIRPEDLPGEIRDVFVHVMGALSSVKPMAGEDAVTASVRKMSMQEADECTALLVEIYGVTSRSFKETGRASATIVQFHTVERDAPEPELNRA